MAPCVVDDFWVVEGELEQVLANVGHGYDVLVGEVDSLSKGLCFVAGGREFCLALDESGTFEGLCCSMILERACEVHASR